MFRGLYIAGTAMLGTNTAIDVVSNNLSNSNTLTYKKDFVTQESFNDVLMAKIKGQSLKDNGLRAPVEFNEQGDYYTAQTTSGYFTIKNDQGISYNSAIKFRVDEEGYLSTFLLNDSRMPLKGVGNRIQGAGGDLFVGDQTFEIDEKGQLLVGGTVQDQLMTNPGGQIIGTMNSGMRISQIVTNFEQGDLQTTENPLDLALLGHGFFEVDTPGGVRYTRNGSFKINADLELVTSEGYKVMGLDGPIVLGGDAFVVNKFGEISENGVLTDKIKIVNPSNSHDMKKIGASLYRATKELEDTPFEGEVIQGALEGSNINSVSEMIEMIQQYRSYEANQRLITSYDNSIDKLLTSLG